MKMIKTLAILAVVTALGSGFANAQGGPPPDDQQGGPPPAGPGGPGGRMQFGGQRRMGGGPMLLMMPSVQKELKLSDDQIQKIRDLMPRPPARGEGEDQGQRPQRMNPRDMDKKLQDILDEGQYKRLQEIRLQAQGPMAFLRPEIQQKLGITSDQKDQIRAVFEKERPSGPPPNPGEGGDMRKMMQERRARIEKGIMAVLTDDQRQTWHDMTGKHFDMPMMGGAFGGPGRFGRRGGGGPGGPGGPGGDDQVPGGPGGGPDNPPPPPPDDGGLS